MRSCSVTCFTEQCSTSAESGSLAITCIKNDLLKIHDKIITNFYPALPHKFPKETNKICCFVVRNQNILAQVCEERPEIEARLLGLGDPMKHDMDIQVGVLNMVTIEVSPWY